MWRSFIYWRDKRNWLRAMRRLQRDLRSSRYSKQIDQIIADGYDVFVERHSDVVEAARRKIEQEWKK